MKDCYNPQATFRPFRTDDYASLAHHADNINIWNNTRDYLPHPYTEQDAVDFIARAIGKEPTTEFAIDYRGKAIGAIGYVPQTDVSRISAEVGYWLGESFWNLGIVTQVLTAFVDYIFKNTDIIHLYANIFEGNTASMRVLEKAGFTPVGIMHRAAIKNGRIIDIHFYECLAAREI